MGYITAAFYRDKYKGVEISDDDELTSLIERASALIDEITGFKLVNAGGLNKYFAGFQKDLRDSLISRVKVATAQEVEFLFVNGGVVAAIDAASGGSASIGGFSYSTPASTSGAVSDSRYPRSIYSYLASTGLLYAGVRLRE